MAMKKKGLGRGLDALLSDNSIDVGSTDGGIKTLRTMDIEPNPAQARKRFEREALEELAESIRLHGILQPIVVRAKDNGFYEIIAGERRWRACKIAGITEIPVIIKDIEEKNAAEISLIENLQRENLNPVEEANGYRALVDDFGLTQEEAAKRVGKSRTAVANVMRILKLPKKVLALVEDGTLSYGHARTLLPLCERFDGETVLTTANRVAAADMSVRQTETLVKQLLSEKPEEKRDRVTDSYYNRLESRASESIGRRLSINRGKDGKGKVTLAYNDTDDLEILLKFLCGNDIFDEN